MGQATYKALSQASRLNVPHGDRDAALAAEPDPARRGDQPWHSPPSHATPPATVNPGQQEEARQGNGSGNRQEQEEEVQVDYVPLVLWWHNWGSRGRTQQQQQQQQQHRGQQYFNRDDELGQQEREKDLMEQDPCGSPQHGQPGEARWRCHDQRNQQQQHTKPLHQDQAGGQHKMQFWNVKKHCWVTTSHMPVAMLQDASTHLRPMNMAGYCLPGMCAPYNTSQYIMDQHKYTWRNEEEAAAAKSGESGNYSTVGEDFLLTVPLPSTAQEDEGILTEEEESTQPAHQG